MIRSFENDRLWTWLEIIAMMIAYLGALAFAVFGFRSHLEALLSPTISLSSKMYSIAYLGLALLPLFLFLIGPSLLLIINRPIAAPQDLRDMVSRIARMMGLDESKIKVLLQNDLKNAYVTGNPLIDHYLVIGDKVINHLTKEEMETLICHELSHIKNRDSWLMTFGTSVFTALIFFLITRILISFFYFNESGDPFTAFLIPPASPLRSFFLYIAPFLSIINCLSRVRDLYADKTTISVLGRRYECHLTATLVKVSEMARSKNRFLSLFLVFPLSGAHLHFAPLPLKGRRGKFGWLRALIAMRYPVLLRIDVIWGVTKKSWKEDFIRLAHLAAGMIFLFINYLLITNTLII